MQEKISITKVLKDSIRLFFAPITGAYRAVISEANRINEEQRKATH